MLHPHSAGASRVNQSPIEVFGLLVLAALGFAADAANASGNRLEALVTRAGKEVTTGGTDSHPIRRLREDDRILEGTTIHIPAGQNVALLCSSDRWIKLHGPRTWALSSGTCDQGDPQDLGTFHRLVPHAGRYEVASGILVRKRSVRDDSDQPIVLSPRRTSVHEPRPPLVWRALHQPGDESAEYEIEITGLNTPSLVPAGQADCRIEPSWGNVRICISPWPKEHPGLKPGETLFWNVGYRASIAAPLVQEKKSMRVSRLTQEASERLEVSLERLVSLPLNATRRSLAVAGLYAEQRLFVKALEQVQEISECDDALRITIGDLYFAMELAELAAEQYREVLETADESATEAAAAYGLGHSLSALRQFDGAIEAFQRAREQFEKGGYTEQAEDAREAQEAVARVAR